MLSYKQQVSTVGGRGGFPRESLELASLGKLATIASLKAHVLKHIGEQQEVKAIASILNQSSNTRKGRKIQHAPPMHSSRTQHDGSSHRQRAAAVATASAQPKGIVAKQSRKVVVHQHR
jgi:hypothetical protein